MLIVTWDIASSMINSARQRLLAGLFVGLSLGAQADCDFDDFPLGPGMATSRVSDNMQWNNLPMNVHLFRSDASLEQVQLFYQNRWEGAVDASTFGPWQQITHINEDCMMMVQMQGDERHSFGRLLLVNPPEAEASQRPLGEGVPIPPEAVVVSDLQSQDRFRDGQLVMLASSENLETSRDWYLNELPRHGWQLNQNTQQANDATLLYSKGHEQLSVVFLRHAEYTQILLNRMDR